MPDVSRPQPAAASEPLFNLTAVSVKGAVAISGAAIAAAYQPYLGKRVSEADLAAIAAAITDQYRTAGYFLLGPSFRLRTFGLAGFVSR